MYHLLFHLRSLSKLQQQLLHFWSKLLTRIIKNDVLMFNREVIKTTLILSSNLSHPSSPEEDRGDAAASWKEQLLSKLSIPLFPKYAEW